MGMKVDREKYKQYLAENGFSAEEVMTEIMRLTVIEAVSSIKIDDYIPYGEQYDKYKELFNIINSAGWDGDPTFESVDRYMHFCLQCYEVRRTAYEIVACDGRSYTLYAEKADISGRISMQFYGITPPSVGAVLELPDAMLQESDGRPLFSNHWLALGVPQKQSTFPEDFNIENDFAFLILGDERIPLQRYYG